ncbi:ABC transporter permease [Bacillus sp. AGMB 02131]|uniref:ABC transporter permease n=1 Tax=Peribacillus faecalis TaxID=2772559 RepID=A0A927HA55_9BACI|nr:ABC transporter permease [Peribacillus faecalis]MBD3107091.1 ABC transporter permease [Peribacillus faecalis]
MIAHLIKKNILVMLRNKHIFIILLLMPIVLISILGFALSDMMSDDGEPLKAKVYIVEHGSEEADIERFLTELELSLLPAEAKSAIEEAVTEVLPMKILKDQIFASEELSENITLKSAKEGELSDIKGDEEATAIIEVPEEFTYHFLQKLFFDQGEKTELKLLKNESNQLASSMIESILSSFQEQYALSALLQKENLPTDVMEKLAAMDLSIAKESVGQRPIINSVTYYTFGMSAMFVFYVASSLASMAILEKENNVFNRILLSDVSRVSYLSALSMTGMIFAFCQLGILFGIMKLVYDVQLPDLTMLLVITLMLSFSIGGFTAFITAVCFRSVKMNVFADLFQTVIVTVLAFVGGSFVPIESLEGVGRFTPNGAGMQAYLQAAQEYGWADISSHLLTMLTYGVILLVAAVFIFPRKERA